MASLVSWTAVISQSSKRASGGAERQNVSVEYDMSMIQMWQSWAASSEKLDGTRLIDMSA